jgi:hypothetical protein
MARHRDPFYTRVAEYVDSSLMTCRLRNGKQISARICGNYGIYQTSVNPGRLELTGSCSCPSEIFPCKHVHALHETWKVNPQSFFDLDVWLKQISKKSKGGLLASIRMMVAEAPELLALFGVEGFDRDDDQDEDGYGNDEGDYE